MIGDLRSYINEARSAVHSGDGTQMNFYLEASYLEAASLLREQAPERTRAFAEDDRDRLAQRFVPPVHFQHARRQLHTHHTTLVSGPPGSGRRTAALMLLHELPDAGGSFHELPDTPDDASSSSLLDHGVISSGDRLLLDLSRDDEPRRYLEVQDRLSDFRSRLIERAAHLAVILPHRFGHLRRSDLLPLTTDIGRPEARRVLAVQLRYDGIVPPQSALSTPSLTTYLARAPLRDVAELADRIRRARDAPGGNAEGGFPRWVEQALTALTDQSARVAADLSDRHTGRNRALLLALAMFHDTTPATVFSATVALLKALDHPPDDRPRLEHSDLNAEFGSIEAQTQASGRVRFTREGYDRAVRNHFWTYLPDVRSQLRDWVGECVAEHALAPEEQRQVIPRLAEQVLRTGRPDDLVELTTQWTKQAASQRLMPAASQALALGLTDDQYGRSFRQLIYTWSKNAELSPKLKQVLVLVCSEVMARTHPDQAMVRLHHLVRRAERPVEENAQRALLHLAHSDNRLYRLLLARIDTELPDNPWRAEANVFLAVADPTRLIGQASVRAVLSSGWAGVLRRRSVEDWRPTAARWLTACGDLRYQDIVLDVLVDACRGESSALGSLYQVACDWAREPSDGSVNRTGTAASLLRKIDRAQGLEPCDFGA
ncbi:ABC transporter substrate-binding protein [Streptomyces sp. NPDC012623]|uniref:nSTAND3 domain-containing NTPase n=1 Tax=unclassified Streptomyces TaxID=2593676 RepID=UPI0036836577